jgi:TolB-like protein/tetratricopeptide (TPR) repeat protein
MAEERVQRRLAAILAADVVGYSRLMEQDEAGTLAALKIRRREILDPLVAKSQGRVFKTTGDGVLIDFGSAVNAVQCAVELQEGIAIANTGQPDNRHIVLRIGVNLGDVIVEGSDLYGDGVNIAVRLEALAEPGGILVSGTAYEYVRNKVNVGFDDLGAQVLKNIAEPVRAYRVTGMPQGALAAGEAITAKPAIAVLPFTNMSGDPEQQYFSDGITEDIITELSRFHEMLVISRNSSFLFRGKTVDVKDVARKLGVQFVVEGSVRKLGNRVRVTVQLIDAVSTAHVWAERYDRDMTDIFVLQDEVTRMVTTQIARQTRSAIAHRSRTRPTENLSAYDNFLRALEMNRTYETMLQAEPYLQRAIELDPEFAVAHGMLSTQQTIKYFYDYRKEHLEDALAYGQKALDLDAEEPWGYCGVGFALNYLHRFDEAGYYLDRAVALNPNDVFFLALHAEWMNCSGQNEMALREIEDALRLDPYANDWFWDVRAIIHTVGGKYRDAIASYRRAKSLPPWGYCYLAICHYELGEVAQAKDLLEKLKTIVPGRQAVEFLTTEAFVDPATSDRFRDIVRTIERLSGPACDPPGCSSGSPGRRCGPGSCASG